MKKNGKKSIVIFLLIVAFLGSARIFSLDLTTELLTLNSEKSILDSNGRPLSSSTLNNYGSSNKYESIIDIKHIRNFIKTHVDSRRDAVIDVGCGFGTAIISMAELGYKKLYAIDIHQEHLNMVENRLFGRNLKLSKNLTTILGHFPEEDVIKQLPEKGTWGIVFVLNVFQFMKGEEIEKSLKVIYDSLKPGGVLLIQLLNFIYPSDLPSEIPQSKWAGYDKDLTLFTQTDEFKSHMPGFYHYILLPTLLSEVEKSGFKQCYRYSIAESAALLLTAYKPKNPFDLCP